MVKHYDSRSRNVHSDFTIILWINEGFYESTRATWPLRKEIWVK